ncbi:uncharacterized protein LOC134237312 [Saccostrea cucullata]|uniref:uncharacterized protein LOC134237312 n=1 Tax=Saccostrea cuccullata TaxID=36930 RepID=UPI002ED3D5B1
MRSQTLCQKSAKKKATDETKFTAKDQLYNDLVDLFKQKDCFFPNSMSDLDVMKNVNTLVNALWLIDNDNLKKLQKKLAARSNNNQETEIRLLSFCGYHDFKKVKKKAPRLSATELKSHSTALFQLISLPFMSKWNEMKDDILELAKCFNIYADQLDKANEEQQCRRNLEYPVREISKDAFLYYVPQTQRVGPKYTILDTCLAKMNHYEYVFFDEVIHVEEPFRTNFDRFDFLQKIALSVPISVLKYNPGGSVGASVFIWRVPTDRSVQEIINEGSRTIENLKPRLLEYHTRRMKSDFTRKYGGLHACQTPKHILRSIYKELTHDASVDQNPSIEYRIQEAISSEDPDLVIDLRHLNTGRPGDTFQVFFDLLRAKVEEQCAADERRHNIKHVARYILLVIS